MSNQITPTTKTAAIYMRVSTTDQEDEGTIENQWLELKQRIEDDKIALPEENIYKDDGWSGTLLERPELDRLRNDAKLNKFDVLYVYDRGRLSRKLVHQEIILGELRSIGISIIELHGVNGNTPEAFVMGSMMGLFHEYERTKITERMRLGKLRIVKENKELLGYIPCYGYDLVKVIKKGENKRGASFVINEEQAENVRYIFNLCAEGNSVYKIIKQLKEDGIKAPRAKSGVWGNTTLLRLLHNTTYIGDHYYNKLESIETKNPRKKYSKIAKASRRVRPQSEWWHIKVPAIIDKELFNKAQKQLEKNAKYNPRNNKKNHYLLAGLVRCECGRARTGDPAPNGHTYYRCNDRERPAAERTCYERGVSAPILDAKVWETICRVLTQPKSIEKFVQVFLKDKSTLEKEKQKLGLTIKKLDTEYLKYVEAYGKGLLDEETLKNKNNEIRNLKISTEAKILEVQRLISNRPDINSTKIAKNMIKYFEEGITFDKKREIVRLLVDEVIANQKEATIKGRVPIYDENYISPNNAQMSTTDFFGTKEIGLNVKSRNCGVAKCGEKHAF